MSDCEHCKCKVLEAKIQGLERLQDAEQDRLTSLTEVIDNSINITSRNFLDIQDDMGWVFRWLIFLSGLSLLGLWL